MTKILGAPHRSQDHQWRDSSPHLLKREKHWHHGQQQKQNLQGLQKVAQQSTLLEAKDVTQMVEQHVGCALRLQEDGILV